MKQCPSCLTTYTDDTLRYCLADGTALNTPDDEQSTVVRSSATGSGDEDTVAMGWATPVRVDIPQTVIRPKGIEDRRPPEPAGSSGTLFKVLMVVIGIGILAVLGVATVGLIYFNSGKSEPEANVAISRTPLPSPTPDNAAELREQIANLEKRLNEQKAANRVPNTATNIPMPSTTTSGRVDSPGDGFLALRSLPNSEAGERILKIPHGASVTIGACGPVMTPVKRSGRWCQASYNGRSGWVFDAYIIY